MQGTGTDEIKLGRFAGLHVSVRPSAFAGSAVLWLILTVLAARLAGRSRGPALLLGLAGVLAHWAGESWHQGSHAWAARAAGHPMVGVQFWGLLSSSIYPPDEPPLPNAVHARRALGGPIGSLLLAAVLIIPLRRIPGRRALWWLTLFFFLDNLLVFGLGALLPLGFTDGSTLLRLARRKD